MERGHILAAPRLEISERGRVYFNMAVIVQLKRDWREPLITHVAKNSPIETAFHQPETIIGSPDVFIRLRDRNTAEDLLRIARQHCPEAVHEITISLLLHDLYVKYGVNG